MSLNKFYKLEGAENDFIFFVGHQPKDSKEFRDKIEAICHRQKGVGADGVAFAHQDGRAWSWAFFNRDGSQADVCGNAARCMAALLVHFGENFQDLAWEGVPGSFHARRVAEDRFAVSWPLRKERPLLVSETLNDELTALNDFGLASIQRIQSGVPHLVLLTHDAWSEEHRILNSPQLRRHPDLGPEGANVTWVSLKNLHVVTFERGVEAETRACGSGALAAFLAVDNYRKETDPHFVSKKMNLQFPGGALSVYRDNQQPDQLWLEGRARLVFEGQLEDELAF